MKPVSKRAAAQVLAGLALEPDNRVLADHWLSLWTGDALPPRAKLDPRQIKPFLPNLLLFEVVPDKSVVIRLAGTRYRRALNTELTGQDWIALAPEHYRAERLRIISAIARGAIGVGHRRVPLTHGADYVCEEILLPFAPECGDTHPVLVHVNWKAEEFVQIRSTQKALGDPLDFRICALHEEKAAV